MENLETLELIRKAKNGDLEATETLIEKYWYVVIKINNKWYGTDDSFQEGILGIYDAIRTFNESCNTKFMTHVWINIESRIRKNLDAEYYKLPRRTIELIKKGEREKITFTEFGTYEIEDKNKISNSENKVFVQNLLRYCTEKEKFILKKIYFEGFTEIDIAKMMKKSRQYVNITKQRALTKLRKELNG